MDTYSTLSEASNALNKKGYEVNYNLEKDKLVDAETHQAITADDFEVVETHRFEGMSNPADNSILFAIEGHNGEKGQLIMPYGMYSDSVSPKLLQKLDYQPSTE